MANIEIATKPKVTHKGILHIANIEFPCFVLEDGRRLISQRALRKGIGMSSSGGNQGAQRILGLVETLAEKGINAGDLPAQISNPIILATGGLSVFGYEATVLTDLCELILQGRDNEKLNDRQKKYASMSEIILRALARVGIIALIDEATGYQEVRDRYALQKILEKYLLQEYAKWAKRFPDEFYQELFRLRGWQWKGMSVNRPSVVGKYTNNIVYERLAPGVLDELRKRNPKDEKGNRKAKFQQFLTPDTGVPALDRHLYSVIALMRASAGWPQFERLIARSFPKFNEQIPLALED